MFCLCLFNSPRLTYDRLWMALPHCTRENIATFQSQRKASDSSAASSSIPILADVFARRFQLTDDRAMMLQTSSSSPALLHLRLAVWSSEQSQRVFFIDADTMSDTTIPTYLDLHCVAEGVESALDITRDQRKRIVEG